MSWVLSLRALEELPEAIETFIQHQAVADDPALDLSEVLRSEAAPSRPPHLLAAYQVRVLQNLDVLLQAGQRDPERLGELADRGAAATETLQDSPACGVRERRKGLVELFLILNHLVQYCTRRNSVQASSSAKPSVGQRPRSSAYFSRYALRLSITFSTYARVSGKGMWSADWNPSGPPASATHLSTLPMPAL